MITQQLNANPNDMSGKLVITAEPGQLPELQSLAAELQLRDNVNTDGTIQVAMELPTPGTA